MGLALEIGRGFGYFTSWGEICGWDWRYSGGWGQMVVSKFFLDV